MRHYSFGMHTWTYPYYRAVLGVQYHQGDHQSLFLLVYLWVLQVQDDLVNLSSHSCLGPPFHLDEL